MKNTLIDRDLRHIWHPCTQMKDHLIYPPLPIRSAKGSYLYTFNGKKIIDAISSWWSKSLGHRHPQIEKAVKRQIRSYEHIIPAGTTQKPLVELSEKLCSFLPELRKVFYADSGSAAIEIAAKIALQYHAQSGNPQKYLFASFENGYHGETSLALSLGDCSLYSSPYSKIQIRTLKLSPLPYIEGKSSPKWETMSKKNWIAIKKILDKFSSKLAAIFFEPIVQGAGGMLIYSPDLLKKLSFWASKNNVLLVADEIMTGFHRTGPVFASMHANIIPDMICLSKGLTAGWGAMSAVILKQKIYDVFYDDYLSGKSFLHSSTYAGNAICAAAANEALNIYKKENIESYVLENEGEIANAFRRFAEESGAIANIRGIGFIQAGDIVNPDTGDPFPKEKRMGFKFYQLALKNGAFLRNLGDTIYFMPPLNTQVSVIRKLAKIATKSLKSLIQEEIHKK